MVSVGLLDEIHMTNDILVNFKILGAIICPKYFAETMLFFAYTTMENAIIICKYFKFNS